MVLDKSGNIYLTGNTGNPTDIITLKYSPSGNLLWSKIYNGPGNREDEAVRIVVDDSGFVYVVGETFDFIEFNNYLTIKYSSKGELLWNREFNFGDSTTDVPHEMIIDNFSNIYITGYGSTCLECSSDFMTVKSDKNGILQWVKFYHGEGDLTNIGWTLIQDKSGRLIVSGRSADINNTYYNATLIYNSNGNLLQIIKYDSADVRRLETDDSNNIYVGGDVYRSDLTYQWDFFFNKYDSSGKLLWNRTYNSPFTQQRNDYFSWMVLDIQNKNIYYTGNTIFYNQNGYNFVLFKYNSDGDSIWKRGYSSIANSNNSPVHLTKDKYNNFYITGSSDYNTPYYRIMTVKYDSAGNFKWVQTYVTYLFSNHYGKRVLIDSSNSVYVGGTSYGTESATTDIVLIKYSQISHVQTSNLIPNEIKLFQNYPNPFNPITMISYELKSKSAVKIKVYDVLGKEVIELVNKIQETGKHEITFDGSNFTNGVYFYNLEINGSIFDTKKLLLIK